jgi:prevent-host-death family protein
MRVVNVKELKSRLSEYLRDVARGEVYLVTDRSRVVARLGPAGESAAGAGLDATARLATAGARLPLRERRASDYRRTGAGSGLTAAAIDALLDESRRDAG